MTPRPGRLLPLVAAVLLGVLASGCGVPLSDQAQPIPGYTAPTTTTSSPEPSPTAPTQMTNLWYVAGDILEPTLTRTPPGGPDRLLALLALPPNGDHERTLVADPTGGPPLASGASGASLPDGAVPAGAVVVELSPHFAQLAAADQTLLIGQVVLTLADGGATAIVFVDDSGTALSVPLPDGRLRTGAVTRNDYASLQGPRG